MPELDCLVCGRPTDKAVLCDDCERMTDPPPVELTSHDVVAGTGIPYAQLARWVAKGDIVPSIHRGRGKGTDHRWTPADRARLQTIGRVLEDLADLGLFHVPRRLVRHLWATQIAGQPTLVQGTVTIRLGLEEP